MNYQKYDIVVVGASFAGLSCAIAAAGHGLKVAIIERRADCGHGLRTTGILVKDVFEHWQVPEKFLRKISAIRLYAPSMRCIDLHHPDYFFCTTNTPELMRYMAKNAIDAGVEIRFDQAFNSAENYGGDLLIPELNWRTKFLIGADGARSAVAKFFNLPSPQKYLLGSEHEYATEHIDTDRFHCFLDQNLSHGYIGWVAPGFGITQIGLALRTPGKPDMKSFLQKIRPIFDCKDIPVIGNRGGLIPISPPFRRFYDGRVILIGDSMSLVSPVTAGGIDYAMRYGRLLGLYLADYCHGGGLDPAKRLAPELPKFYTNHILRHIFDYTPNWAINSVLGARLFKKFAECVFFSSKP